MQLIEPAFSVRHSPCTRIAARRDECPKCRRPGDRSLLIGQQRLHSLVREAALADQIANRGQCRHPYRPALCQPVQRIVRQIGSVLDRVNARRNGRGDRCVAVRVRHDRKSGLMRNVRQHPDLFSGHGRVGQHTVVVEVHQARDHDFDEVPAARTDLRGQRPEFRLRFIAAADEAAVVAALVDREAGRAVADAVFLRDLRGKFACAPAVAAVAQKGEAERSIVRQCAPDEGLVRRRFVPGQRGLPVGAVQRHMDMTVTVHALASFPAFCPHHSKSASKKQAAHTFSDEAAVGADDSVRPAESGVFSMKGCGTYVCTCAFQRRVRAAG